MSQRIRLKYKIGGDDKVKSTPTGYMAPEVKVTGFKDNQTQAFFDKIRDLQPDDNNVAERLIKLGQNHGNPNVMMYDSPQLLNKSEIAGRENYNPITNRMSLSQIDKNILGDYPDSEDSQDQYNKNQLNYLKGKYISELSHAEQTKRDGKVTTTLRGVSDIGKRIIEGEKDIYNDPSTMEFEAHRIIQPDIKKEWSKMTNDDQIKNVKSQIQFNRLKYKLGGDNMERKVIKQGERKKAFIGAIIGAAAGLVGGGISAIKKGKAEQEAFQQQQDEQYRQEGVQQAQAMTSSYANQGYVDQYQDKFTLKGGGKVKLNKSLNKNLNKSLNKNLNTIPNSDRIEMSKKFAVGGRKKADMGSILKGITSFQEGVTNSLFGMNGQTPDAGGVISAVSPVTDNGIAANNKIATDYINSRIKPTDINQMDLGVYPNDQRRQASFGSVAGVITGAGGIVNAFLGKPDVPKMVKKADGFTYNAPKTGLVQNSYQVDANGNPIQSINDGTQVLDPNSGTPIYTDRVQSQAKMGSRIKRVVAKSNGKY